MSLVAYANKTKKELSFDDLAGPLKKKFRSRNTARKTNYTITDTKYQNGLHKQIIATTKLTHLRSN